jgi:competence protein ComEA
VTTSTDRTPTLHAPLDPSAVASRPTTIEVDDDRSESPAVHHDHDVASVARPRATGGPPAGHRVHAELRHHEIIVDPPRRAHCSAAGTMPHRNPITALRPLTLAIAFAITSAATALAPAIASASPRPIPVAMLAPPLEGTINVNTASQEQLELLPGVGPTTATRILEFVKKKPLTQ